MQATCVQDFRRCRDRLDEVGVTPLSTESGGRTSPAVELRERVEAIGRWYRNDWMELDNKLRSSIVEGISVFLSLFDHARRGGHLLSGPACQTRNRCPVSQKDFGDRR